MILALKLGTTVDWATETAQGKTVFNASQTSKNSRYQDFVRWLNDIKPEKICFYDRDNDDIYNRFVQYLIAWCVENNVKHMVVSDEKVSKYSRGDSTVANLLGYARNHRW